MKLSKFRISNWKSFEPSKDSKWIYFQKINVFIGPNSHGKTNLANALRLVFYNVQPDYGGDPKIRKRKEIQERDFNCSDLPIVIEAQAEGNTELTKLTIESDLEPKWENPIKGKFFPIGATRKLHKITSDRKLLNTLWNDIFDDCEKFFQLEINRDVPKEEKCFLSDLKIKNGQILYESGSGISSILYFIIETKIHIKKGRTLFLFEEPEIHMHPSLIRSFIKYLIWLVKKHDIQFFLTTHSPILIDKSILPGDVSKIFQIRKENGNSKVIDITDDDEGLLNLIYNELGNKPSDILLANCVIWVEGPSDRIYLNRWIADHNSDLEEGRDYSIMFYGGSLINYLSFNRDIDKFIKLRHLNPNSAIIMDSDLKTDQEKLSDKKKNRNKTTIKTEFENKGGFGWITDGKEIENYLNKEILEKAVASVHKRKKYSIDASQHGVRTFKGMKKVNVAIEYNRLLKQTDFSFLNLENQINKLVEWIRRKADNIVEK